MVECCVQENNSSQKQIVIYNINKSSSLKMAWIDFFHIYGPYFFHRHVNVIHDDAGSTRKISMEKLISGKVEDVCL